MSAHALQAARGRSRASTRARTGTSIGNQGPSKRARWCWAGGAVLLGLALLLALQSVLQASVDQEQVRRAIKVTQLGQARQCTQLVGGRRQEVCLLALNASARADAAVPASLLKTRSSP
ncbi:hypothetical protein [Roseateles albus]|uniref:Uncharacterized protein n=1 Tax=Roseateles albus TaxID=2987525 RepID=A0ABT5KHH5_9BURK|nr:hypothetical protein [Roseateles albus]MDC8773394.1 hypothetical protein [Roseateles albus]